MDIKNIIKISVYSSDKDLSVYKYVLYYGISNVVLSTTSNFTFDPDECLEAYFFDENGQAHIYRDDDILKVAEIKENDVKEFTKEDDQVSTLEGKYSIQGRFSPYDKVVVRSYFSQDEDGQVYVAYKRLVDLIAR
jgi:hypothetical protein